MVRGFGLLLIAGIAIGFLASLTIGFAALGLLRTASSGAPPRAGFFGGLAASLADAGRKTERRAHPGHPTLPPPAPRLLNVAIARPGQVLAIGLVLSIVGFGASTRIDTVSDVRELGPSNLGALEDLKHVQDATGVSGELDVLVRSDDLTDPAVMRWMASFKDRALDAGGFSGPRPSCLEAELCPGPALSDFVTSGGGKGLRRRDVRATFRALPSYDLRQLATLDPDTGLPSGLSLLSFGIRAQSLEDQQELIDRVEGQIGEPGEAGGPPAGVSVATAGLPVIASEAAADLSSSRYLLTLAGLVLVGLALLAAYRSLARAILPLLPVLLATGWSALFVWVSGISLDPMSTAIGALTIAIATEFSVILSARFHAEREGGAALAEALRGAYSRTGPAVLASAATVVAGFAVLMVSDVSMLRSFGFVTVVDLVAAVFGVFLVLPAALAWAESRRAER
jgi:predicted RND superfamily exporter protein